MDSVPVFRQKWCGDFSTPHEGLVILQDQQGYFHAQSSGKPAYAERYKGIQHFQNGWAWVQTEDGIWKMINSNGAQVHGPTNLTVKYE